MSAFADGPEVPLLGGDVTEGVVRIGDTVRRPRGPHSELAETVLVHLERVGFDGAPRFLGTDAQGRQVLSYVEGEVAGRPWPSWVADDERGASVARLVRRLDDAMLGFGLPEDVEVASREPIPGMPASVAGPPMFVGHMDITPENVVFVDGSASALIDFDFVTPTDRVGEVGNLLLWWAPLLAPTDRPEAVRDVDFLARARLLVDEYGLSAADRAWIVAGVRNNADRAWYSMRDRAERLGGGWRRMWDEGIGDVILRRQQWLAERADDLGRAVTGR